MIQAGHRRAAFGVLLIGLSLAVLAPRDAFAQG
jgi:hypothetical protein